MSSFWIFLISTTDGAGHFARNEGLSNGTWAVILTAVVTLGVAVGGAMFAWMMSINSKLAAISERLDNLTNQPQAICERHAAKLDELERRVEAVE